MATADALLQALDSIPLGAVPGLVDALLLSAGLHSSVLLNHLINTFPSLLKDHLRGDQQFTLDAKEQKFLLAFVSTVTHLFKKPESDMRALKALIWIVYIPILKRTSIENFVLHNQVAEALAAIAIERDSWGDLEVTLVPYCLTSVVSSVASEPQVRSSPDLQDDAHPSILGIITSLRSLDLKEEHLELENGFLPVACQLLATLLQAALKVLSSDEVGMPLKDMYERVNSSAGKFARQMVSGLLDPTLDMLSQCSDYKVRQCAMTVLLPPILRTVDTFASFEMCLPGGLSVNSRVLVMQKVWSCCKCLFSQGSLERRDAYTALSAFVEFMLSSFHDKLEVSGDKIGSNGFDVRSEKEFWEELRAGLVDEENLTRKKALHVLKVALGKMPLLASNADCHSRGDGLKKKNMQANGDKDNEKKVAVHHKTKRDRWADMEAKSLGVGVVNKGQVTDCRQRWEAFILLYEMLEEYGTHLVEAAWTHQISLLLPSMEGSNSGIQHAVVWDHQSEIEHVDVTFLWMTVLWQRGFDHGNPQVRRLIMQSFLELDWTKLGSIGVLVPQWFVLGPFIQALNDPIHHKDFGIRGIYSSETSKAAAKFIRQYSASLSRSARDKFVLHLASCVKCESLGRAGLMTLALCIKEAACGDDWIEDEGTLKESTLLSKTVDCNDIASRHTVQKDIYADLVEVLRIVVENSKQHFNPKYRSQVCEYIIVAASTLVVIYEVPFSKLLHFLSSFPREFIVSGGVLHSKIMRWFSLQGTMYSNKPLSTNEDWIARNLCNFAESFLKPQKFNSIVSYDDEELDAWRVEAERWARIFCFGILEENQISQILIVIQNHVSEISQCAYNSNCMPEKLLLLILSVLKECQPQKQFPNNMKVNRMKHGKKQALVEFVGGEDLPGYLPLVTNVSDVILSIMGELISYARSSFTIFWSADFSWDGPLPGSVTGKLGGPSQRRLPSSATSSVLRAILALKTVAECTIWCACLRDTLVPGSVVIFLWEFAWNVVNASIPQEEMGAEIRVGAYEALVSVCKALAVTTCPSVLTSMKVALSFEDTPQERLIDELVWRFLHSINLLLQMGSLARSRRAVLLHYKWCCLDSFLSISRRSVNPCSGMPDHDDSAVSDAILENVIFDATDSLESADEDSILPILRTVRWVMNWGLLKRVPSNNSLHNQKKAEIMWSLVQSTWTACSDCNKRRVAPIAALLSAIFHPSIFGDIYMHDVGNNTQGPLKWLLEKLLEQGVRSPRTMRLTALHLTGMWLIYPATITFYLKQLKLLTLHGSVAIDEDLDGELLDNYVAAREYMTLVQSTDPELTEAFVNSELYARVTVAVLFHKLADQVDCVQLLADENIDKDVLPAFSSGKMFLLELVDSVVNDVDLARELYKKSSSIHRRKTRVWQMICILSRFVDEGSLQQVTSAMHKCLYMNNLPAVRQYIEIFAMHLYLKFPSMVVKQMAPILYDYGMKPQALSSYVFIAVHVLMNIAPVSLQFQLLEELLPALLPFLTSHHHSLRGFSQILVYRVLRKFLNITQSPMQMEHQNITLEKKCLQSLIAYLEGNADCARLRSSVEKHLDLFDPVASATPRGIFCFKNGDTDPSIELPFECVPVSIVEHVIDFLNEVRGELRVAMEEDAVNLKNEELRSTTNRDNPYSDMQEGNSKLSKITGSDSSCIMDVFSGSIDDSLDFQKKILSHRFDESINTKLSTSGKNANGFTLAEIEIEDQLLMSAIELRIKEMDKMTGGRQDLIVVASLLGRIPNLAGLARTCEVFKVASLVIADASIIKDKQFQLISVTAEKWIPIQEVPELNLKEYLKVKKREGYAVLGLEQTANSIPLNKYPFPLKTVIVLGREKEGIPVDIIHVLDACVEIPQYGVVRSLNVHVSGAIAIWEYTRQHHQD